MLTPGLLIAHLAAHTLAAAGCPQQPALEITHVHVIDVLTGAIRYDATLTIDGGRICRIAASGNEEPHARQRIDGRGRFALPGLWSNPAPQRDAYRLIGYGITEVASGAIPGGNYRSRGRGAEGGDYRSSDASMELYDQVKQLSADGRSALQVLQFMTWEAATRAAAARAGQLAAGFEASLILLEANPLDDVANLRTVSLVVQHGVPHGLVELARARAGRPQWRQPFSR